MNFDFGQVLTRAGQITWKHKNLWLAGIVITLVSFLSVPINLFLNPGFTSMTNMTDPSQMERQLPLLFLVDGLLILLSILSVPVYTLGMAIPSLATVQLEKGAEKVGFGEALRGTLPYFWRILAIFLLVTVAIFLVMAVFFGCLGILAAVTFGLGMVCMLPLFILFIPLAILVYAFMEQAMVAVLADNLGVIDALRRAWDLVKQNLLVMALMSLIIYFGSMIVSMVISAPMMIPMFGLMGKMMSSISTGAPPDLQQLQAVTRSMLWWMLAFLPLYAILEGVLFTFMQSAWTLTYLRLTRSPNSQTVLQQATV